MRRLLLTALTWITLLPASASATVMVEVPIEDMARDADAIVLGRVTSSEVRVVIDPVRGAMPRQSRAPRSLGDYSSASRSSSLVTRVSRISSKVTLAA